MELLVMCNKEREGKRERERWKERKRSDRACTTRRELRRERMVNGTLVMCNKERKGKRDREMERKRKESEAIESVLQGENCEEREW